MFHRFAWQSIKPCSAAWGHGKYHCTNKFEFSNRKKHDALPASQTRTHSLPGPDLPNARNTDVAYRTPAKMPQGWYATLNESYPTHPYNKKNSWTRYIHPQDTTILLFKHYFISDLYGFPTFNYLQSASKLSKFCLSVIILYVMHTKLKAVMVKPWHESQYILCQSKRLKYMIWLPHKSSPKKSVVGPKNNEET